MGDLSPTITNTMTMLALYPPEEVLNEVKKHAQDEIIENGPHVTLVRLGQTSEKRSQDLLSASQRVAKLLKPIELGVEGAGFFDSPDATVGLLLVNGVRLDVWRGTYISTLDKKGLLPYQPNGYIPHLTLGYYPKGHFPKSCINLGMQKFDKWVCDTIWFVRGQTKTPIPIGENSEAQLDVLVNQQKI